MNNMKKMLESQQKINEAARCVIDYFSNEDYETHLEQMLSAQTQIIGLMELAKNEAIASHGDPITCGSDEIVYFLHDVHNYLRMLKPFIELAEQQSGKES